MQYVLLCVVSLVVLAGCAQGDLRMLHAQGTKIVDDRGEVVRLRGVNLGGWLVEETWMMPFATDPPEGSGFPHVKDHVSLWSVIEKRLGKESAARIRTALRDAWLNESDFDRIHAAGYNCVRLPFLYTLLDEPGGLDYLDRAIAWAGRRGIYVILDLHGAPGCQSKDHHSGETGRDEFFKNPQYVEQAAAVWQKLATRYKGNPVVAGYDLLNEPMGAPDAKAMHAAHDRLYKAVRTADPGHLVFIEDAYKGTDTFPKPETLGWNNVAYSVHVYGFTSKTPDDQLAKIRWLLGECEMAQLEFNVPIYVGEFNQEPAGTRATMQTLLAEMTKHDWAYSIWTYKVVMPRGNHSMWGNYRNPHPIEALNPFTDSEPEMLRKIELYRTEHLEAEPRLIGLFQKH